MSSLPLAALAQGSGFARDTRFDARPVPITPPADPEPGDPLARAWADGFAAGEAEARAAADTRRVADDEARARLALSFARIDADLTEQLRDRLHATIQALCEATLAPVALDPALLARRAERAAAMLSRAEDDRVLRLHPDDLALIAAQLPADLPTSPDPQLERGTLRIETSQGGVEDGPEHWRRAIAEALARC